MTVVTCTVHDADLERFCAVPGPGGLTPEDVRNHAPDALLALDAGDGLAARASLWWNRVPHYPCERIGLIGHYAADDAAAAAQVLSAACAELARHSCTLAVGPMDGSTWRRYRLLTERGAEPPFFLEPDNPDDWPLHFEALGFTPLARYCSSLNEDVHRPWPQRTSPSGFVIRSLAPERIDSELHRIWQVATSAFAGNFLYTPIEEAEFRAMYLRLLPVARPELVLIAEHDERAAGFCFAVPDLLQARRDVPVDTFIIKTLAVLPEYRGHGLATLLTVRANEAAARLGIRRGIHALMHEDNPSRKIGHGFLRDFRRYTLFARPL